MNALIRTVTSQLAIKATVMAAGSRRKLIIVQPVVYVDLNLTTIARG
jgi:hypothetical protein